MAGLLSLDRFIMICERSGRLAGPAEEFEALAYPFAQIPRRPTRTSITSRSY
ncbi:MAG: hypothetical protein ACREK7_06715 [Gemmatimonadota bacterium]